MLYKAMLLVQLVAVNAFGVVEPTCNKKGCYLGSTGNHFCLYSRTEETCVGGYWTENCGCEEMDLEGCFNPADNTCSECQDHAPTSDSSLAEGKTVCAAEGKVWKTDCTETMCEMGAGHHNTPIPNLEFPTCKQAACFVNPDHKCNYDYDEDTCSAINGVHNKTTLWYENCPCKDASAPASSPASSPATSPATSGADEWWTGLTNKGSCYIHGVGVTCNKDEASCAGSHYPSGFVSGYSKCCHCKVGCDSSQETAQSACTYSDDASDYE